MSGSDSREKHREACDGVQLSHHHVNPEAGNESLLLRYDARRFEETPSLLVDAGQASSLDEIFRDDDRLTGILLTHVHRDQFHAKPDALDRPLIWQSGINVNNAKETLTQVYASISNLLVQKVVCWVADRGSSESNRT